jgi:anti-anti-sigma factor
LTELASLTIEEREEVVVAAVQGELDISNASSTGEAVERAVPGAALAVVMDFTQLDFLDSSGVSMMFALARRLGSHRQQLLVVAPAERPVRRVLDIVEFARAAPLHETVDEAVTDVG